MKKVYVFTKRDGQGYLGKTGEWVEDLAQARRFEGVDAAFRNGLDRRSQGFWISYNDARNLDAEPPSIQPIQRRRP